MMKINWTVRKSNAKVLNMVDEPKIIIQMIEIRKTKLVGQVIQQLLSLESYEELKG